MTEAEGRGYGFGIKHVYLVLDGSGSMIDKEIKQIKPTRQEGLPKHERVAQMVQDIINDLFDDKNTFLSVIAFDADDSGARITEPLDTYDTQEDTYKDGDISLWDPLSQHGSYTPIGQALSYAREKAEAWVKDAVGQELRRAAIFLLSDGMNNRGDDGRGEKAKIEQFNAENKQKGYIRLATIGYYQFPADRLKTEGVNIQTDLSREEQGVLQEETQGRELLKAIVASDNPEARQSYFEASDIDKIKGFIQFTVQALS